MLVHSRTMAPTSGCWVTRRRATRRCSSRAASTSSSSSSPRSTRVNSFSVSSPATTIGMSRVIPAPSRCSGVRVAAVTVRIPPLPPGPRTRPAAMRPYSTAPPGEAGRAGLPVQLEQVLLDPLGVGRVRLERQVLLERRLGALPVLLLVVEETELPVRIGEARIQLRRTLVALQRLLRLGRLVGEAPGPLGLQAVEIAVVELGDRVARWDGQHAVELALGRREAAP